MKMIDLTHTLRPEMPVYPGAPQPVLQPVQTLQQHGCRESELRLWSHHGTHIDAPAHMVAEGKTLDALPLERFFGLATMLDVSAWAGGEIPLAALQEKEDQLQQVQFVLLRSGWEKHWGEAAYFHGYPCLSAPAAAYLAALPQLQGIGVDMLSVDAAGARPAAVHRCLLQAEKLIVENLCHLDAICGEMFLLSVLPLKFAAADGAPVRAVAFEAPAGIYYPK